VALDFISALLPFIIAYTATMDESQLYNGRRAQTGLEILIVGGGLAGLAAAYALETAGHHTTVIDPDLQLELGEKSKRRKGSWIRVAPNAVKILDEWGVGEELRKGAFTMDGAEMIYR
jgi:salicylate hydroxylase